MKKTVSGIGKRLLAVGIVILLVALTACPSTPATTPTPTVTAPPTGASPTGTAKPPVSKPVIVVPPPTGAPRLVRVMTPSEGATLGTTNTSVIVAYENLFFKKPAATPVNKVGEGHLNFYLDVEPPRDKAFTPKTNPDTLKPNSVKAFGNFGQALSGDPMFSFRNMPNGPHTVWIAMVGHDDVPIADILKVSFTTAAAAAPPSPTP